MNSFPIRHAFPVFVVVASHLAAPLHADPGGARLYWTDKDDGQLEACDLDGGNRVTLLSGLADPRGIAVDAASNKIYWGSHEPWPDGGIYMADCDGSNVEFFLDFLPEVADIALDAENGMLYWVEENENRICCTPLDSPNSLDIVIDGLNSPYYLAIDPAGGFLYWSDFDSGVIHRATLDGENPVDLITGQSRVRDIELADGFIYWCDRNSSQIRRREIDGAGSGTILFSGLADSLDRPHGLVLDPDTGTMYWTDTDTLEVNRAAMDGSGSVTTLVSTGLNGAWGIDLTKPIVSPYEMWLTAHFTPAELANPANEALLWGESADPDQDGALNLIEFAQGTSPRSPHHDPDALQVSSVEESGERLLQLVFRFRSDDPTLVLAVESSPALGLAGWQTGQFTEVPPRFPDPAHPGYEFVTMRSGPISEMMPQFFARLRVSR